MRCSHCGQSLEEGATCCTRCGADLTSSARKQDLLATLVFALISLLVVSLLIYLVLHWHDAQLASGADQLRP